MEHKSTEDVAPMGKKNHHPECDSQRSKALVLRASLDDIPDLADVLARAFDGDPLLGWLTGERDRLERLRLFFGAFLKNAVGANHVLKTEDLKGVAIWFLPGQPTLGNPLRQLMAVPHFYRALGLAGMRRAMVMTRETGKRHPKVPHYYLTNLAVSPLAQGKGYGAAMLTSTLENCDREGIVAALETANERTMNLYRRHGFVVNEEFSIPLGGPKVWSMWRKPCGIKKS